MEQLIGALGGTQVAARESEIGIDHAHQCKHGKVMALGDDLGPDQKVDLMARDALDHGRDRAWPAHGVARQQRHASRGKQARRLLRQALHPRPAGSERPPMAALRAFFRQAGLIAAVMALQLAGQAVLHEPGRAVGAIEAMTAGPAERQRGITAAIEKQQGLLARRQRLFQVADETR